jgi:uncharacterized MAPEG superfamily protein
MHPEILRELTAQRGRDLRERAHRAQLARTASQGRRAARRHARHLDEADAFVVPAIPDYVDGSFRTTGDEAASQVPAARHAA